MEKCKKYLKSNAKINFTNFDSEWQFIKHCKSLRNKIIHQGEKININNNTKALIQFIESHKSLDYSKDINNIITFTIKDKDLTDEFIKKATKFIQNLLDELSTVAS